MSSLHVPLNSYYQGSYTPKSTHVKITGLSSEIYIRTICRGVNNFHWETYCYCDKDMATNQKVQFTKEEAYLAHESMMGQISEFLLIPISDMPKLINRRDKLIKSLVRWRLLGWA